MSLRTIRMAGLVGAAIMTAGLGACTTSQPEPVAQVAAHAGGSAERFPIRKIDRRKFPASFAVQEVDYASAYQRGAIVVDVTSRFLYVVQGQGRALRYPIAVGAEEGGFTGATRIQRKQEWPAWRPTPTMHAEGALPATVEPGPHNPLGARALYLYKDGRDTLLRIHGTSEPWLIGQNVSSGCIRMFDEDVADLYRRTPLGTTVIFARG